MGNRVSDGSIMGSFNSHKIIVYTFLNYKNVVQDCHRVCADVLGYVLEQTFGI